MDDSFTPLRLHAINRLDLQPLPRVHLGGSTPVERPSQRLVHDNNPLEQITKEDADTQIPADEGQDIGHRCLLYDWCLRIFPLGLL